VLTIFLTQVAPYFAKVECFCFDEQKLLAGEEVDMPLFFFIDKDILDDPGARNVTNVVLNYTFFKYVSPNLTFPS
jgi:cytochrome c oxidase assembly protein subunit 11